MPVEAPNVTLIFSVGVVRRPTMEIRLGSKTFTAAKSVMFLSQWGPGASVHPLTRSMNSSRWRGLQSPSVIQLIEEILPTL
jgi:hypothetical protein